MLEINIITLFPNLFSEFKNVLPFNRAIKNKLLNINIVNLRDYAIDNRGTVDDKPYGGGTGMILRPEPLFEALSSIQNKDEIIAMNPRGQVFDQKLAQELVTKKSLTIICGRYEGIDQRILDNYCTKQVSLGNFICSGGEAPAITMLEAIIRLIPGVLEEEVIENESHSSNSKLEYPQYTRPEVFNNLKVPEILLSGNHAEIEKWKKENSTQN